MGSASLWVVLVPSTSHQANVGCWEGMFADSSGRTFLRPCFLPQVIPYLGSSLQGEQVDTWVCLQTPPGCQVISWVVGPSWAVLCVGATALNGWHGRGMPHCLLGLGVCSPPFSTTRKTLVHSDWAPEAIRHQFAWVRSVGLCRREGAWIGGVVLGCVGKGLPISSLGPCSPCQDECVTGWWSPIGCAVHPPSYVPFQPQLFLPRSMVGGGGLNGTAWDCAYGFQICPKMIWQSLVVMGGWVPPCPHPTPCPPTTHHTPPHSSCWPSCMGVWGFLTCL